MSNEQPSKPGQPDLSELSGFHFGTAWLSSQAGQSQGRHSRGREFSRDSQRGARRDSSEQPRRFSQRQGEFRNDNRQGQRQGEGRGRQDRRSFSRPEAVKDVQGEIRAIEAGLSNVAAEVHKHKRIISMFDLAKLVVAARERYEVVLTRQQPQGPTMIQCSKDFSTWLTREEAEAHIETCPVWIFDFYTENKEGETSTWQPKREGDSTVLTSKDAVVADFKANHFDEVFATKDQVIIPGSISAKLLSPGILGLLIRTGDFFRKHPTAMIAKLCQAMARYHLPIFKWKGSHHTGPARPKVIPANAKLSERPEAIIDWIIQNPGQGTDVMILSLAGEDPNAHQLWVADLLWLLEQGYVIVNSQKQCFVPKGRMQVEEAPVKKENEALKQKDSQSLIQEVEEESSDSPVEASSEDVAKTEENAVDASEPLETVEEKSAE